MGWAQVKGHPWQIAQHVLRPCGCRDGGQQQKVACVAGQEVRHERSEGTGAGPQGHRGGH